jgi:hypothetical protein
MAAAKAERATIEENILGMEGCRTSPTREKEDDR